MDNLTGVDADADGWDAFDELISDHSDSDPDDLPTQDEVDDALGKLDQLGWDEFKDAHEKSGHHQRPHEKPSPSEPQMEMQNASRNDGNGYGGNGNVARDDEDGYAPVASANRSRMNHPKRRSRTSSEWTPTGTTCCITSTRSAAPIDGTIYSIMDLPSDVPNKNGITADELMLAFNPIAVDEMGYGGMGGMFPMGGMYPMRDARDDAWLRNAPRLDKH